MLGTKFEGKGRVSDATIRGTIHDDYQLFINDNLFGEATISRYKTDFFEEIYIQGNIKGNAVFGDSSIPVNKVIFCIPNLREFRGEFVEISKEEGERSEMVDRLTLENEDYIIHIYKNSDYKSLSNELSSKGGFLLLYNGEILSKKNKRQINHKELESMLYQLSLFFTFLNGRRTSLLFVTGKCEEEVKWVDYSVLKVDQYKGAFSWPPYTTFTGVNDLWYEFSQLCKNEDDQSFLENYIHWYVEANLNSGYIENATISAQICLELIYNYLILEKKKLLLGKDASSISASNKLRILASQLNVNIGIPEYYKELNKVLKEKSYIEDGIDAFVQIRNAIVHSQEEKRKKLKDIPFGAKFQALEIAMWLIELSGLYILGYKGLYKNRCSAGINSFKLEEQVPFVR